MLTAHAYPHIPALPTRPYLLHRRSRYCILMPSSGGRPDASRVDVGGMEHLLPQLFRHVEGWDRVDQQGCAPIVCQLPSWARYPQAGAYALPLPLSLHRSTHAALPSPWTPWTVQVLTQLLLYYTRFLDLIKSTYPDGAPFARYILSIPTLMNEIRTFSRNF